MVNKQSHLFITEAFKATSKYNFGNIPFRNCIKKFVWMKIVRIAWIVGGLTSQANSKCCCPVLSKSKEQPPVIQVKIGFLIVAEMDDSIGKKCLPLFLTKQVSCAESPETISNSAEPLVLNRGRERVVVDKWE